MARIGALAAHVGTGYDAERLLVLNELGIIGNEVDSILNLQARMSRVLDLNDTRTDRMQNRTNIVGLGGQSDLGERDKDVQLGDQVVQDLQGIQIASWNNASHRLSVWILET